MYHVEIIRRIDWNTLEKLIIVIFVFCYVSSCKHALWLTAWLYS